MKAAAEAVIRYRGELDRVGLFGRPVVLDAILWNPLVLGEAAKNVPEAVRRQHAEIPWRRIAGFRDVLAHGYFGLDEAIVWDVIANKVPALVQQLGSVGLED